MKLSEIEQLKLQNIDLKMKLIRQQAMKLNSDLVVLQNEGNVIINNFCKENNVDVKDCSINIETGDVTILKQEVKDANNSVLE